VCVISKILGSSKASVSMCWITATIKNGTSLDYLKKNSVSFVQDKEGHMNTFSLQPDPIKKNLRCLIKIKSYMIVIISLIMPDSGFQFKA